MSWGFHPATERFDQHREKWDALNRAWGDHILLDSGFVRPLLRHFGGPNVFLGFSDDPQRPGAVLIHKQSLAKWETFQPSQAPLGLILLPRSDGGNDESLLDLMASLPGYALQLSVLQQDPDISALPLFSGHSNIQLLEWVRTARFHLDGTFEEFWEKRSPSVKQKLARSRRRLEELGHRLELVAHTAPESMSECIREHGRLESEGWKGREGTAIAADNPQGAFYRDILDRFCATGEGMVFQLLLDGKVVASELCLTRRGMHIMLKTAYDENFGRFSPGMLMRQEIMKKLYEEKKISVVEFYGRLHDWQAKWTEDIRTMYHVNVFRHAWVGRLRSLVKRFA